MATNKSKMQTTPAAAPGFAYFTGMLGALVYFVNRVDGFWLLVLAFLKALIWPAYVVYYLLKFLIG